jgi:hypothetical protein
MKCFAALTDRPNAEIVVPAARDPHETFWRPQQTVKPLTQSDWNDLVVFAVPQRFYDHVRIVVFFELSTRLSKALAMPRCEIVGAKSCRWINPTNSLRSLGVFTGRRHAPVIGNYSGSPALRRPSTSRAA